MRTKYKILKDAVLMPHIKAGTIIYEFDGHDHGCVRDDFAYGGLTTKAMIESLDADSPFFTVPVEDLELIS